MGVEFKGRHELMSKLRKMFETNKNVTLEVGFFGESKYPPSKTGRTGLGHPKKGEKDKQRPQTPTSVPEVAAVHEFGSKKHNIPERPFLRTTIHQLQNPSPELRAEIAAALSIDEENGTLFDEKAAGRLGEVIRGLIQDNILQEALQEGADKHAPLKDETLRKRRYRLEKDPFSGQKRRMARVKGPDGEWVKREAVDVAKPLVDTGLLMNSVSWEIKNNGAVTKRDDVYKDRSGEGDEMG